MSAETVVSARRCLCGEALTWTVCCDLPVCTDCEPGPWASAADGSGEFGHIGPCPGHNMAGYPVHVDEPSLLDVLCQLDLAREAAVILEQQNARLLDLARMALSLANDAGLKQRDRLIGIRCVLHTALDEAVAL